MQINVPAPPANAPSPDVCDLLCLALERETRAPWRQVCESLFVERVAPYRAVVLRGDALQAWRDWNLAPGQSVSLQLEVFAPLA